MTPRDMYYSVVMHWHEFYQAFRDDRVEEVSKRRGLVFFKDYFSSYYTSYGCAYCVAFGREPGAQLITCIGCPISLRTQKTGCHGTPWAAFNKNPSTSTALAMREFVRTTPPEGVPILNWLPY